MPKRHPACPRPATTGRRTLVALALAALGAMAMPAPATTLRVPLDQPDLAAAIAAAAA
ncbi:hypothetical protein GF314_05480, partial [bacterium]|nr:hypothetical protein [bacterium]